MKSLRDFDGNSRSIRLLKLIRNNDSESIVKSHSLCRLISLLITGLRWSRMFAKGGLSVKLRAWFGTPEPNTGWKRGVFRVILSHLFRDVSIESPQTKKSLPLFLQRLILQTRSRTNLRRSSYASS